MTGLPTIEEIAADEVWQLSFGVGLTSNHELSLRTAYTANRAIPKIEDIAEVLFSTSFHDDCDEDDRAGLFRLKDGRFVAIDGGFGLSNESWVGGTTITVSDYCWFCQRAMPEWSQYTKP